MITVTSDSAGLLAQIFPALLIALLLEAKARKGQFVTFWGLLRFGVRALAIGTSLSATFVCILAATADIVTDLSDVIVNVAFWLMFLAFVLFINDALIKEVDES